MKLGGLIGLGVAGWLGLAAPGLAAGPTAIVPGLSQEIAGVRIGWRYKDLAGLAKLAIGDGKPVVFLFVGGALCNWCNVEMMNTLRCPTFNTLAGKAHFVILDASDRGPAGDDTRNLLKTLRIQDFPTLSIMSFKASGITELTRITGAAPEQKLIDFFARGGLNATNPRSSAPRSAALGDYVPDGCLPGPAPAKLRDNATLILPSN